MNPTVNIYSFQDDVSSFRMLQENIRTHKINNITVLYNNISEEDISIDDLSLLHIDVINNVHNEKIIKSAYNTIINFRPVITTTFESSLLESLGYQKTSLDFKYLYKCKNIDTLTENTQDIISYVD